MVGLLPSEQSAGNTCISSCGRHGKAQPSRSFLRRVCVYLFLLAVAVGHTSAANCVPASGGSSGETFCTPERTELQLLKDVNVSANSTIKNGEQFCFVAGDKIDCDIANNDHSNVSNILQPAMRWQSAVLPSRMEEVSVTLRFATHLILYSIRLMFTNVPAVFAVQSSRNGGQDWKTLYTYVRDLDVCDTLPLAQKPFCGSFTPSGTVEVFSQQMLIDMLSNASGVNSYLMGDNSPMVNAIRLVFSELYVASVPATPLQQSRLLYYQLDQLIVTGTCWCNGHAQTCLPDGKCNCTRNTVSATCQACAAGFYRSNISGGFTCRPCQCNTSAGAKESGCSSIGICQCRQGYTGQHCDVCMDGYHRQAGLCMPCNCGSATLSPSCDMSGQCACSGGAAGLKCDACLPGYYGLRSNGCSPCNCSSDGGLGHLQCNASSGQCNCKPRAEGRQCDRCEAGYILFGSAGCVTPTTNTAPTTTTSEQLTTTAASSESSSMSVATSGTPSEGTTEGVGGNDSSTSSDLILVYAFIPAAIALLVLVIVIVYVYRRHRRRSDGDDEHHRGSDLKRKDSSSSRATLHRYAANGPSTDTDDRKRTGRNMSNASLYSTAELLSPQLRNPDFARAPSTTASAPGSKRQSLINDERFTLPEECFPHFGESSHSLTAYDISKITHPPPEPYASSKPRLSSVGSRVVESTTANTDPTCTSDVAVNNSNTSSAVTVRVSNNRSMSESKSETDPPSRPTSQYTLPDMEIKRQRRSLKLQKSLSSVTGSQKSPADISPANIASPMRGSGHLDNIASPLRGSGHLDNIASPLRGSGHLDNITSPLRGSGHLDGYSLASDV